MFAKSIPQKEEILSLSPLIESCLQAEKVRNISDRSLKELRCHLNSFSTFCQERGLRSLQELTPAFCRRWIAFLQEQKVADIKQTQAEDILAWIALRQNKDNVNERIIEHELCVPRSLYEYLINFHHPSSDPCGCLPDFICKQPDEQDYVSVDEVFHMLDTLNK